MVCVCVCVCEREIVTKRNDAQKINNVKENEGESER